MDLPLGQLERPDHIVLVGYFALMLGIGLYFYRYMRGIKDYFSGGNRIPWWLSGVSFYMSSFSVAAFVQYSALAYMYGWVAVTMYWVTIPATVASVVFFAKRWRRARIDSPVEYLETRYSSAVRQLFAWQGIPVRVIDDALKLVAIGLFISPLVGWSVEKSMLVSGLIMLAYTFMGGLWAVTVTDFLQFIVMTIAVIVLLPLSFARTQGVSGFFSGAPEGFFNATHEEYNWFYVVLMIMLFILAFCGTQWALIQRYYCVPREKDAYKVGWLVVCLNIIGPPLMFLPAMAAKQWLGDIAEGEEVYPLVCTHLLPAGMLGLVMAAMFSATMSMLSSDYNVCASVLTNDVYRRLIRPGASQEQLVWVGRGMTLLVGLISLGAAWWIGDVGGEGLFRNMIKLFSVATAPVAIPMLAGLLTRRVTNSGALAGFLAGITLGIILFFACPDPIQVLDTTLKKENVILIGTIAMTLAAMTLVSWRHRWTETERQQVDSFLERLDAPIGQLEQDRVPAGKKGISPFRVVGISTALIGLLLLSILHYVEDQLAHTMDLWIGVILTAIGGAMTLISWRKQDDLTGAG